MNLLTIVSLIPHYIPLNVYYFHSIWYLTVIVNDLWDGQITNPKHC